LNPEKLHKYIEKNLHPNKKTYIFLDEIQEVESFEKVVNSLNATKDVDIYITGSNSRMLSGEYATLLSGRYISFTIYPFSFKEMVNFYNDKDLDALLNEYIKFGGFPIIQNFSKNSEKRSLLSDLYDSIVVKDIVKRNNIKSIDKLDRYISYMLNTISSLFSGQNIIKYFKSEGRSISKETLYNYIKYLKDVMLLYSAKRYDIKGKKLLSTNEKFFVNDQGIRAIKFDNIVDIEKILENIVYFELLRRGYTVSVGEINGKEIDFIASKAGKLEYYQVAYLMETKQTRDREFGSLNLVKDQYPKFVISMDKVDFSNKGIIHKNMIDFLLH
jgi:predicted AAA+ superfamily ATPase